MLRSRYQSLPNFIRTVAALLDIFRIDDSLAVPNFMTTRNHDPQELHVMRIKNVVAVATASSPFMQSYLDRAKDMFTGRAMQEQMRVSLGETIVNSERAMTAWLYAGEYHRDKTKMIAFLKGRALPPENIVRPLLMLLLRSKIDAILALGNIIHRILSSAGEISA